MVSFDLTVTPEGHGLSKSAVEKLPQTIPQIADILGLKKIPKIKVVRYGVSFYRFTEDLIHISTFECELILPKLSYFKRKRWQLSAYGFDFIEYTIAHELSHTYQYQEGYLKYCGQDPLSCKHYWSWKGGKPYNPRDAYMVKNVGHHCDPIEIDANRRASHVTRELWKLRNR